MVNDDSTKPTTTTKDHDMKSILTNVTILLLGGALCVPAENPTTTANHSAEFERMKTLVGTWQCQADLGEGPVDMTVDYRLLAGGSVLEERVFAGTPNEMVTMYFEKDGKLALTHYCLFGNRPGMVLKSSDENSLRFDFDASCGIDVLKESHMNSMTITFKDANTITAQCKAMIEGRETDGEPTVLKRVKS
jgi:hypothetical protein